MSQKSSSARPGRKHYMVAMVLGTALTALGPSASLAREAPEATNRAVVDISRYCTTCWRNARLDPNCWSDCTQEVFRRLLERLSPNAWTRVLQSEGEERREFLRAIDAVKKRTQRGRRWAAVPVENLAERRTGQERLADERAAVEKAAVELLNSRQQRILQMSFEGWSVQDIARELGAPAERISDEKYKAIRKLREHLRSDLREEA